MEKKRLLRITTVPLSLVTLLKGQLNFIQDNGFDVLTVSAHSKEVEQLNQMGINHTSILLTRKITPFADVVALVQLVLLILRFKPHIVHTHTPKAGLLGMIAAWVGCVPIRLHTIAGLPWMESTGWRRRLLQFMERITYRCAHRVYPNSINLQQFLLTELKFDRTKTKVIGRGSSNGIDSEYFKRTEVLQQAAKDIRIKHSIPELALVFSFVGRIVSDKGIVELVEAFMEVDKKNSLWLILVGDFEPDLDPLPAHILKILQDHKRIIMAGFQQDVRPWLLASDAFLFPSYREGFPNGVLQAACLELPVIASNINGCNEIIEPNKTGLLIPPKDTQALIKAMHILIHDTSSRKEFGKNAREFVVKNFDQQYVCGELLKEYESFAVKQH